MCTDAQRLANQQNARRSTGPRTEVGKARSRLNALKHGLCAETLILDSKGHHESREEFDDLLAVLNHNLAPESPDERLVVEEIAECYWRLLRTLRTVADLHDQAFRLSAQAFTQPSAQPCETNEFARTNPIDEHPFAPSGIPNPCETEGTGETEGTRKAGKSLSSAPDGDPDLAALIRSGDTLSSAPAGNPPSTPLEMHRTNPMLGLLVFRYGSIHDRALNRALEIFSRLQSARRPENPGTATTLELHQRTQS